ncbi:sulfotransferase family protein [Blastococcus colisei]|nr:sulfotransferase [Blastococcus colisei]
MSRTKVLSIVGPGRSGTTLLAGVLGEVDGVCNVGELRWLWHRGILQRRPCGCGRPPDECPVWSQVIAKLAMGSTETPAGVVAAQDELAARRHRLRVIRGATRADPDWSALQRVRAVTGQLIRAITDVTGARVIVDSSKRAQDAAVLAGLDEVDHYVVHIVRDPAAVAFSWQRRDKTVQVGDQVHTMTTRRLLPSLQRWSENALSAEVLRRCVPSERWMFLRYEDFVAAPRPTVSRLLAFLGEEENAPFVDEDSVVLGLQHTVAGNPNRFRVGRIRITLDDEWRSRMPRRRRLLVRALTWPLLLRYRYPVGDATARSRPTDPSARERQSPAEP